MTKAEIAASWDHAFAAVVPVELRGPMAPAPPARAHRASWARAFEAIAAMTRVPPGIARRRDHCLRLSKQRPPRRKDDLHEDRFPDARPSSRSDGGASTALDDRLVSWHTPQSSPKRIRGPCGARRSGTARRRSRRERRAWRRTTCAGSARAGAPPSCAPPREGSPTAHASRRLGAKIAHADAPSSAAAVYGRSPADFRDEVARGLIDEFREAVRPAFVSIFQDFGSFASRSICRQPVAKPWVTRRCSIRAATAKILQHGKLVSPSAGGHAARSLRRGPAAELAAIYDALASVQTLERDSSHRTHAAALSPATGAENAAPRPRAPRRAAAARSAAGVARRRRGNPMSRRAGSRRGTNAALAWLRAGAGAVFAAQKRRAARRRYRPAGPARDRARARRRCLLTTSCDGPGALACPLAALRAAGGEILRPPGPVALAGDGGPSHRGRRNYEIIDRVAIIPIFGILVQKLGFLDPACGFTGYDGIRLMVLTALEDRAVAGIALTIDSAGGEIGGLFDLADMIFAARERKPIWAILAETAASAAYALAAACSMVTIPRTGSRRIDRRALRAFRYVARPRGRGHRTSR